MKTFLSCAALFLCARSPASAAEPPATKLYWFIPDGTRAEPYLFNIYAWAREGKLPNIKRMMDQGAYGYCKPVYPGHTPVNFATLLTGTYPERHGVADVVMRTAGNPLNKPSIAGFNSTAKKVEPIWVTLEKQGKTVALLSLPGSTPPELENGYTMVGRWSGWGASFYAVNFEELGDGAMMRRQGRQSRLFFSGPRLTMFRHAVPAQGWAAPPPSRAPAKEVSLEAWGATVHAYIHGGGAGARAGYDRIAFSFDKKKILADLKPGDWSDWLPIELTWDDLKVNTTFKIKVIKLDADGFYKVRFLYNSINETLAKPSYVAEDLTEHAGPMVDYPDSYPPQLVFYPEDKDTFLEEAGLSFDWHRKAAAYFLRTYHPDVFIHTIYTPNQMLTSRWWLGYVDPASARYGEKSAPERDRLWSEVKDMYTNIDGVLGAYLDSADTGTVVAFTSDHGILPLHAWVHLNNLFAREGWLKFKIDKETGEPDIDWRRSQVVYLKFDNIYIAPDGLHGEDGNWRRASGPAYEKLRAAVISAVTSLQDGRGVHPAMKIARWEDAESQFRLPHERVGDLIVANRPGYGWNEEMSEDLKLFSTPLETGYKQAILPDDSPGMRVPFMVMGPGVKRNYFLGDKPIDMVDQYPTLMRLLRARSPQFVQGKVLDAIFTDGFNRESRGR
jgi:predicted AlkP superfamily phosphohydrolase/phosphomutase